MSKKVFVEKKYNVGIIESYKPSTDKDSPILGTFEVKGMTVENMISQNKTKYVPEVWAQLAAFGKGGKFIDENGKLRPSTLFGSLDHPDDGHVELLLKEAAIAWVEAHRNDDGSWDGVADVLNNPNGRIVKTFLDYSKARGGGHLLGVSSRALGESVLTEANGEQVEAIVPESFELMSFDFVYNPSFQTAVAHLTESKKHVKKSILVESVRNLAKEDEEHAKLYESFANKLEEIEKDLVKKESTQDTKEKVRDKEMKKIIKDRGNELEFYVLHIDTNTDEYLNDIEFKTYKDAREEFNKATRINKNDRIELIFSPDLETNDKYQDNEVLMTKGAKYEDINKENLFADLTEGKSIDKAKAVYMKELREREKKLHDAIYDLKNMTDEEFSKTNSGSRTKMIKVLEKDYEEVLTELKNMESGTVAENKKPIQEAEDDLDLDLDLDEDDVDDEENLEDDVEDETEDEEDPVDDEEEHHEAEEDLLASIAEKLDRLIDVMQNAFAPVEDPELELDPEADEDDNEEDELDEEDNEDDEDMLDIDEDDLENMTDEELEYLASLEA
jgi:hypothetical protein